MARSRVAAGLLIGAALVLSACSPTAGSSATVAPTAVTGTPAASPPASAKASQVTVPPITVGPSSTDTGSGPASSTATTASSTATNTATGAPSTVAPTINPVTIHPTPTTQLPPPRILPAAIVSASPALGDAEVVPSDRPKISVRDGLITSLTLTNPEGNPVKGTLSADRRSWVLAEDLGFGRAYSVSGEAIGENGQRTRIAGTWTTVAPDAEITTTVSPGDGAVVGVAAPVIIRFGIGAQDHAEIMKHVTITTTPKVEGGFAWVTHDGEDYRSLDFRPKSYWPEGTKVHVAANMYGVKFAEGYYGGYDVTSDFTIGRNQVVYANAKAHNIVVKQDGKTVATYEASYGSGDIIGDPNRVTRSGVHIVMDKQKHTKMSNPAYGYINIDEYWAVRISNNGEFIHQNQGTVDSQGNTNVSHGCVNLSAKSAEAYFKTAIYGDPVEVTGTTVGLSARDGDIYDWAIPWSEWTPVATTQA